jgi:hypothetical protein
VAAEYTVTDPQGAPVDGLTLQVTPWMPAMGHGTSVDPTVSVQGQGIYLVQDIYFYMPGQWELRTDLLHDASTDHVAPTFQIP